MQPEYLHVLLCHLLVMGVGLGLLATVLALWLRSRAAELVGLMLLLVTSAMAYPVAYLGHEAYRNIRKLTDEQGEAWLDLHLERAESTLWIYYVLTMLVVAAIVIPRYKPHYAKRLIAVVIIAATAALGTGAWISTAGGRVRHPEFRPATPLEIPQEAAYEVEP